MRKHRHPALILALIVVLGATARPALADPPHAAPYAPDSIMSIYGSFLSASPGSAYWCLDVDRVAASRNGTPVRVWSCDYNRAQHWYTEPVDGGYAIHNKEGNLCLDADTVTAPANHTKVQLWQCNYQPQQTWTLEQLVGDTFVLINKYATDATGGSPVVALDLSIGGGISNGKKVQLYEMHVHENQQWSSQELYCTQARGGLHTIVPENIFAEDQCTAGVLQP